MTAPKFTPGPWQFVYGDVYDHGEDCDANGFTVLMSGSRLRHLAEGEGIPCDRERLGRALVIHELRYAEDIFPEDVGRPEAEANARLIAAAPEMAEALEPFADIGQWLFARDLPDDTPIIELVGIGHRGCLTRGDFKKAFSALAKAQDEP